MKVKNTWGDQPRGRNKRIQGEATAFILWRTANSLGWDCTLKECAKIAGVKYTTAVAVVARKDWAARFNDEAMREVRSAASFKAQAKRYKHIHTDLVDVCDMMEWGAL